jgi:DNA modification methylase
MIKNSENNLKIIYKKIDELKPYEKNPRQNDAAVPAVAASIKEFGFKVPMVITSDGVVVTGHTRLKAAKTLGLTEVPVVIADDLTPEQIDAFRLADNKTSELAKWDEDLLHEELLKFEPGEMTPFGFEDPDVTDPEIDDLIDDEDAARERAAAKDRDEVRTGDVYELGSHRIMCGDSTDPAQIERLMGGETAKVLFTDPPYGVDYGEKVEALAKYGKSSKTRDVSDVKHDTLSGDNLRQFLETAFLNASAVLDPGAAFYVFHADCERINFQEALAAAGLVTHQTIIWNKSSLVLGRSDYQWKHEPCLYGWKEGRAHYFISNRKQSTVLEDRPDLDRMGATELRAYIRDVLENFDGVTVLNETKPATSEEHPTMKPVRLCARLIRNSSKRGWLVLDPFGGSGSTLIAAEQLNRRAYLMEIDPEYVAYTIERWEALTGKKARKL